jgi:pimeloyl-ACP methyl ester carboxylesterase
MRADGIGPECSDDPDWVRCGRDTSEGSLVFASHVQSSDGNPTAIEPFRVAVPQAALDDLQARLALTRWPDGETFSDWTQGVPLSQAKALIAYWQSDYDWRVFEDRLNAYPQFHTKVDGLGIHFIHVRSRHEGALPLLLTHGWPGSIAEFLDVIGPLTDPTEHGGSPQDAFHVVIPSLPGYGFSDKPTEAGWNLPRIARAWDTLMGRLGYERYVAQGGDWGAGVATWMARQKPAALAGIHLNLPLIFPPPPPGPDGYDAQEELALQQLAGFGADGAGYAELQRTRPQTLGYGLADSPVGQAAWIYEKMHSWSDGRNGPAFSFDTVLDEVSLYWLTNSAASSARLYHESFGTHFVRTELDIPVGVSIFEGEGFLPPRSWGEKTYSQLMYWNVVPVGGHFAALEQPALFVEELRACFRRLR